MTVVRGAYAPAAEILVAAGADRLPDQPVDDESLRTVSAAVEAYDALRTATV